MRLSRSHALRPGPALALAALLAAPAAAHDVLYVSGATGRLERGDPVQGHVETLPTWVTGVTALAVFEDDVYVATPLGVVGRFNETSGQLEESGSVTNDATAITADPLYLYVGGSNGTVLKLFRFSFFQVSSFSAGLPVTAMVQIERTLYVGSASGVVRKGNADTGLFEHFGDCGAAVGALALDSTHLVVADTSGRIHRMRLEGGAVDASFDTGTDGSALVLHDGALLVGDSGGFIERRDAKTGGLLATFEAGYDVAALALSDGSSIGTVYCYGQTDCPCGNSNWPAACRNSTGFGASLSVSGSSGVSADDLALLASFLPAGQWGRFFMGAASQRAPFGDGLLCTSAGGTGLFRFPIRTSGPSGTIGQGKIVQHSLEHFSPAGWISAGDTRFFQLWYRDPSGPCGSGFNTSTAAAVAFTP